MKQENRVKLKRERSPENEENALRGLNKKIKLVPGFEHSLSRLEDESAEKAHFRKFERSYAIGLCTRFYFKHCKLQLVKIVVKKLLRRDTYYLSTTLKALWYGKHHRA